MDHSLLICEKQWHDSNIAQRGKFWAHSTLRCTGMPVTCIEVIGHVYVCYRHQFGTYSYFFSIRFWNCFDSVVV